MKKTAILVAMQKEYDLLSSFLERQDFNFANDIVVALSGIGKVNAALTAAKLIEKDQARQVISTGVAGGLDTTLNKGDLVVGNQYAYHDVWCGEPNQIGQIQGLPARFNTDADLLRIALSFNDKFPVRSSLIVTGDQFVTEPEELKTIQTNFPTAAACDMESAAIAQTCHLYNIPFLSVRIISDVAGKEDGNDKQYQDFWSQAPKTTFQYITELLQRICSSQEQ